MDNLRNDFSILLNNIKAPANSTDILQQSTYNKISNFINENVPHSLFRYRRFNDYSIDGLVNDQIWMSLPKVMNDVFDSLLFFDRERIRTVYESEKNRFDDICEIIFTGGRLPVQIFSNLDSATAMQIEQMLPMLKGNIAIKPYLKSAIQNMLNPLFEQIMGCLTDDSITCLQEARHIACFSETILSNKMWGHYADYHTGFALEYDFTESQLICSKHHSNCGNLWLNYPIFPVIYGEEFDGTEYAIYNIYDRMAKSVSDGKIALPFYDWTFLTKGYLYKSNEWEEEREWRLLSKIEKPQRNPNDHIAISHRSKAIYCGKSITPSNKEKLITIAKLKNIPIYEMTIDSKTKSLCPTIIAS